VGHSDKVFALRSLRLESSHMKINFTFKVAIKIHRENQV
jgi:hypothetical protein